MSIDYEDERDYGGDEVFEDTGSMHSDTDVSVLHDMERELEGLVRKYQVPSNELDNLLKVPGSACLSEAYYEILV